MALSPAKKSVKKIVIFWPFVALFCGLIFSFAFDLLAECFDDNAFYSLLNFYVGKYIKSVLRTFVCIFWKSLEK